MAVCIAHSLEGMPAPRVSPSSVIDTSACGSMVSASAPVGLISAPPSKRQLMLPALPLLRPSRASRR
jgi:hypothetical protein